MCIRDRCREAIVNYLSVYSGNDNSEVRPNVAWPLHHSLRRAVKVLERYIKVIMEEQDLLASEKHCAMLLKFLSEHQGTLSAPLELTHEVTDAWSKCTSSTAKWEKYRLLVEKFETTKFKSTRIVTEVMFKLLYPRLDVNVSKSRNHLLKSVFSLHPSTGNVCVPIEDIGRFSPLHAPTIRQLLNERQEYLAKGCSENKFVEESSMGPYVKFFRRFVEGLPKAQFETIEEMQKSDNDKGMTIG
eukprot:TRINITY_DN10413_c0_g2_i3.p1 TRINITY_DN10413_c0_g2~~TRINITY_DN10413_c0_g2_i3.p1  ORF type:complete len:258 (+),score=58.54 TRINITY_DN10413_c0_g2_i3:48-776(+)